MALSEWDRDHVTEIMWGEGDWFTAHLLRLILKADDANTAKIAQVFPDEVALVEQWTQRR